MQEVVFVYGSLMAPQVWERVVGGSSGVFYKDGTLDGYKRFKLAGRDYPGVIACAGSQVAGKLVFNVDSDSMCKLDVFEGSEYVRERVKIATNDDEHVEAQIYIWRDAGVVLSEEWSFDEFRINMKRFLRGEFGV